MDDARFDDWLRAMAAGVTRRTAIHAALASLAASSLAALAGHPAGAKKKRKKKKCKGCSVCQRCNKKKGKCQAKANGTACNGGACQDGACVCPTECCSDDDCDGKVCSGGTCQCPAGEETCGAACCGVCQQCDDADQVCVFDQAQDHTPCDGGKCCGGVCCPLTCQCGSVAGPYEDVIADLAHAQGLPYPYCFATGTGKTCGSLGGSCDSGTNCVQIVGGFGVCVGLCPDVDTPALPAG